MIEKVADQYFEPISRSLTLKPLKKIEHSFSDQAWVYIDVFIELRIAVGESANVGARAVVMKDNISGYRYSGAHLNYSHGYLLPAIVSILEGLPLPENQRHLFELGCVNGSIANHLTEKEWDVVGGK